jgi:hypothetical protein
MGPKSYRTKATAALALAAGCAPALAQSRFYVGPNNGSWNTTASWSTTDGGSSGAAVPVDGDYVTINGTVSTRVLFDGNYTGVGLGVLVIGGTGGATATLSQATNAMLLKPDTGGTGIGQLRIGWHSGERGVYELSGGSLTLTDRTNYYGALIMGYDGHGELHQSGGALVSAGAGEVGLDNAAYGIVLHTGGTATYGDVNHGTNLIIGYAAGSGGEYHLSTADGPAALTVYGAMTVGLDGAGTFTQSAGDITLSIGGGDSFGGTMYLAPNGDATASYTMDGGTITVNGYGVFVGSGANPGIPGGTAVLTINPGASILETNSSGLSGGFGVSSTGTLHLHGGSITLSSSGYFSGSGQVDMTGGSLSVGQELGCVGTFTQTGGTVTFPGSGRLEIASGGHYSIGGTATPTSVNAWAVEVGGGCCGANGTGTLDIGQAAVVTASQTSHVYAGSTVNLNSGGELDYLNGVVNDGTIYNNGGILNITGTVSGAGSVVLGGNPTFTGGVITTPLNTSVNTTIYKTTGSALTISGVQNYAANTTFEAQQGPTTFTSSMGGSGAANLFVHANATTITLALDSSFSDRSTWAAGFSANTPGTVILNSGSNEVVVTNSLTIDVSDGGRFDINDNTLIIQTDPLSTDHNAAVMQQVTTYVRSGHDGTGGTWTGTGILSGVAHSETSGDHGVGMINNDDTSIGGSGNAIYTTFRNTPVNTHSIILTYAANGDNNLDGVIDATDVNFWVRGFQGAPASWIFGDYNYDGVVDLTDCRCSRRPTSTSTGTSTRCSPPSTPAPSRPRSGPRPTRRRARPCPTSRSHSSPPASTAAWEGRCRSRPARWGRRRSNGAATVCRCSTAGVSPGPARRR